MHSLTLESFSFLNDLDRIAKHGYVVSDNDIVRARLRTVGVQEYRLKFDRSWDNPGCRSLFV